MAARTGIRADIASSMQCKCSSVIAPFALSFGRRAPVRSWRSNGRSTHAAHAMSSLENQLPCQQTFGSRSRACRRACIICGAQKQEDKEKDIVGGIDINQEGDIWEGEAVGVAVKVAVVAIISGAVAAILLLARPVIENTVNSFPYRTNEPRAQNRDDKSLIPGLDSGQESGGLFD